MLEEGNDTPRLLTRFITFYLGGYNETRLG